MHSFKTYDPLLIILVLTTLIYACEKEEIPPEPYERVQGFVISATGDKLLATSDGLYVLKEGKNSIEQAENGTLSSPYFDLAFFNTEQELWLASHAGAINSVTLESLETNNSELPSNEVNLLHFDGEKTSYFATPEGLSLLNQENWLQYAGLDEFFLDYEISDIGTASNGFTYVCTLGGGIERFSADVDGISGATLYDTEWTRLESNTIHSVFIYDTLQAYGTDAGAALHFSEYTKRDWQVFTTEDGLVNDTVLSIVRDLENNWWFGTPRGISRLREAEWTSYTLETHSIISNEVKFLALDPEGIVWMATDEGLSKFVNNQWVSFPKKI